MKSQIVKEVAAKLGIPVIDIPLAEPFPARDLIGQSEADYIEQRAAENDYDRSVEQ